jgi:uncharacterized membrane protein
MEEISNETKITINPFFEKKERFWELDFLRGLCIILMIVDHFFFSSMDILPAVWGHFGTKFWLDLNIFATIYWVNNIRYIFHYIGIMLFMLLCGISCTLSKNNVVRATKAAIVALLITVVTYFAGKFMNESIVITFGTIHSIAAGIFLFALLDLLGSLLKKAGRNERQKQILGRIGQFLPALVGLVLLILYFGVPWGHFEKEVVQPFSEMKVYTEYSFWELVTDIEYSGSKIWGELLSVVIPMNNASIPSSDYMPMLPYNIFILLGSGIGRAVYHTRAKNFLKPLDGKWNKPVCFAGRHSLFLYVLHQVLIIAFFFGVGAIFSIAK